MSAGWRPLLLSIVLVAACGAEREGPADLRVGRIRLQSDHAALTSGFAWAREAALKYVHRGDPVGPWFEAALPGREAFCMRDVSHQTEGALALGLYEHTLNMARKFAASVSEARDWCGYWEIDRYDRPAPVDYRSDSDFWYNLPANFDLVQASERAWQWTADSAWLADPFLAEFYQRSLDDYVRRWDPNGDGIMESPESAGSRGIPTYWEGEGRRPATGGDLVAAQFAANRAWARMLRARRRPGDFDLADRADEEADRLQRMYDETWWSDALGRYYTAVLPDGSFDSTPVAAMQIFSLYFGIAEPARVVRLLQGLGPGANVEEDSYLAEAHYRYGRDEAAFDYLLNQMSPSLDRREYPENPFTAVGTTVRWLAGIRPIASEALVETRSRLPAAVGWIELDGVPVFDGSVRVRHAGRSETALTRSGGSRVRWRAAFDGRHDTLYVDGLPVTATSRRTVMGEEEAFVTLTVKPGETRAVSVSAR
ncbi:MAG: hypothetical protein Q8W46_01555 [Candidatus Palauibacterales bacterium]|nr:hypothetical protein [Candidatus Palauibacterales bacterium]